MDTSELGLERLVCEALTGGPRGPPAGRTVSGPHLGHGGVGWFHGNLHYYDWECRVDLVQFRRFLHTGQPDSAATFRFDQDCRVRRMLLARPRAQIPERSTIDMLRNGIRHGSHHFDLFHGGSAPGNSKAVRLFERNRFTVTLQHRYSRDGYLSRSFVPAHCSGVSWGLIGVLLGSHRGLIP